MTSADAWYAMPILAGRLIRLEPITAEHAPGYLAAAGTGAAAEEVFRWLNTPGSVTGEFAGTTSYYDLDPQLRTLAIGATWLGKRWWRTGRKHRIRRDGTWRTTVQYSMTDDDWPAAHDALTRRLARG